MLDAPLFEQIATRIRHQIAMGELKKGDALPSLRDGAVKWNVNLHTVRRAYQALNDAGLAETLPRRGTRVAAASCPTSDREADLEAFAARVAQVAAERFRIDAAGLAERLERLSNRIGQPVWVVECSESLAAGLASRIAASWWVDARPWPLSRSAEVPGGDVVATYYHYAEVRGALEEKGRQPAFFGVTLDKKILSRLIRQATKSGRVVLLGAAPCTGQALASDLRGAIDATVQVQLQVTKQPERAMQKIQPDTPVIVSPENWDQLKPDERRRPNCFELRLLPNPADMEKIALARSWRRRPRSPGKADDDATR